MNKFAYPLTAASARYIVSEMSVSEMSVWEMSDLRSGK
jgi:hypothetical protein